MHYLSVAILLSIFWLLLSGHYVALILGLGALSILLVTWFVYRMDRVDGESNPLRLGVGLLQYLAWLMWQVVLSNLHLLKLAFQGPTALSPQIIRYETTLKSDFEKFLLANSITLTPGTITMKILGNTFYVHAVSDFTAKGLDGEMERRISAIFNPQPKGGKSNG